tara:strand:+ start:6333 stop:6593 length:261 start_codon:yes stop_codon:yes gene_type:complete
MKNKELLDLIIEKFDGIIVDDFGWEHYTIPNKKYDIRFDPSRIEWACDCPAFVYRRRFNKKYCKHITEIQERKLAQRSGRAGARVV